MIEMVSKHCHEKNCWKQVACAPSPASVCHSDHKRPYTHKHLVAEQFRIKSDTIQWDKTTWQKQFPSMCCHGVPLLGLGPTLDILFLNGLPYYHRLCSSCSSSSFVIRIRAQHFATLSGLNASATAAAAEARLVGISFGVVDGWFYDSHF